jgi:SAM-dependent methyltransferase
VPDDKATVSGRSDSAVAAHYGGLLAPIYLWMAGGPDAALAQGADEVAPLAAGGGLAVDLGAGFGMHAVPLARAGWEVVAIDASETLLAQLTGFGAGLAIRPVRADLRDFARHLQARPRLALCMGDTLTHLADLGEVEALLRGVADVLAPGGRFVATFRDYTVAPIGSLQFVPVRADDARILTCVLQTQNDRVIVHDVLHERRGEAWSMRVGSYPKLRLAPDFVRDALGRAGLATTLGPGPRGLVRVEARA